MQSGRALRLAAAIAMVASVVTFAPTNAAGIAADIPGTSTLSTIDAGAYIVDMGVEPQTYENGLLPYGLVYELIIVNQIPVEWVINDAKAKDGVDFTFDGKDYKGGAFIVLADYAADAAPIIATWQGLGVVVDGPTASSFQAPVFDTLTNWPNAVLDAKNGGIAQGYYEEAGIPQVVTTASGSTKTAYQFKDPALLDSCDDLYVMPHADPEWETHQNLVTFNDEGGYIWAACHAVSVLENVADPTDGNPDPEMNFLSTNGLIDFGDHDGGTPPYSYRTDLGSDPIMQFMGIIDGATENGSEQIYVPSAGSAWRPSSTVLVWDPDHPDLASQGGTSPGEAAKLVYGRGFGDDTNGYVMFEGGHSHNKGSADAVAAIRAFFNLHLMAGIERGIETEVTVPQPIVGGATVDVSGVVTGGTPDYAYQWTSSCGGTFATASGTTSANEIATQFTAPTTAQDCIIRLVVDDTCGRTSFSAGATTIVEIADLAIDKTDGLSTAESGTDLTYTLTVDNLGPGVATNVVVDDAFPPELTYVLAVPSQGSCFFDGTGVICDLGEIAINGSATIEITGTIDPDAVGVVTNTATVSADQLDPDPSNDSSTDETQVGPNGLGIVKTADPDFVDEADLPASVTFTMDVTNDGPNPISNVVLTDDTCSPVTFVGGDTNGDSALDPGEVWQYTCTIDITNDTDNTATVTGDDLVLGLFGLSATDTAHVEAIAPDFTITKGPDGAEHSDGGDVAFEIVVTNSGDVPLFDLVITDADAPGCDRFIGELAVGQVISYYCSISPAPAAPASGTNTISGTALDEGGNPLTRTDDAPWSVVDRDLDLTKTPIDCTTGTPLLDPAYYPGDTVCYEIVVTNSSATNQSNVTLTDNLPAGLTLVDTVVVAPTTLVTDDFNTDLTDKTFFTSGLSDWNDDDKADGGDVSVQGDGDCPGPDQCLEIKAEDVGIQWQTDLSGTATIDAAFDWRVTANDAVEGFFDLACWDGGAWIELQQFTIDDDTTLPATPGPVNVESFTGLSLPAGCQIAGGAVGLVMDPASTSHEIFIDNISFTLLDGGGGTVDSLFDDFEAWDSQDWNLGWLEFNDNDDKTGGDVRSRNTSDFNDCDIPGECAVGIEKDDLGIYFPSDYSTLGQCTIAFDWAVFETENDPPGRISVGGIDAGGLWVQVDEIDISGVAAPTGFTSYAITIDDATFPALFHAAGGLGAKSGVDNDKELFFVDNMAITCLDTFTTTANPDVVTVADGITLIPGDTITATVTATVDAPGDAFPRELANLAQTTSDEQPTPSEAVATVERVVPLIDLQKDVDPLLIAAGDTVTYTFTVENPGNEVLENVTLTDTGIAGCTPVLVSGDDGDNLLALTETWIYECSAAPPSGAPTFVNTATVEGDPVTPGTGEATTVSATDDATVEVVFSGIEVVKTVDRPIIRPNESVVYTYEVTPAAGTAEALSGVFVTDDLCSPVVGPNSGDDGDGVLEDGETWVYTCGTTLTTTTTNTATATATDRAGVDVSATDTETVTVITPGIDVVKTATPDTIDIGDTVTYTIDVVNTGNDPFTGVAVTDDTCAPLTGPTESANADGVLEVGETWTYTCSTAALTDDTTNVADAGGVDSLGKTWSDFDDAFVNVLTPSLAISKLNDGALILPDELVTYTIIVFNDGDSDFDTVTVTDDTCAPLTGPTGDDGDNVLEVGESWFYECVTTLATTTVNTVTVDAQGPGGNVLIDDSSEVRVRNPQLEITKTPTATLVDPGTVVTYDFAVTNTSVCAAGDAICEIDHELQNVVVSDDHCAVVDPVDADGDGFNDGDTGDAGPDGLMSIGEAWLFTCSEAVTSPTTNTASATATDVLGVTVPLTPPTVTAFVDVTADPVLELVKTGPAEERVGQTVTYTFDLANATDCTSHADPTWCEDNSWVENVTVDDDVAGAATPVEVGGFNAGDTDADGFLDVGETWQFTVDYVVTDADLAATPLVNTATASGTDRDGDTEEATASHSLDVLPRESDLSLAKTISNTAPLPGEVVTFTITVTNDGPDDATGVAIQDVVPAGFLVDAGTISNAGVLTGGTIDWTALDVAAGVPLDLTFDAAVQTPTAGAVDEYRNTTQVTASDNDDPDSTPNNDDGDQSEDDEAFAEVVVQESDLMLIKAISNAAPNVGDTVTFTITVSNNGPDEATGVAVADVVPAGYVVDEASIDSGGILAGDTITWTDLGVAAFGFTTLTFSATVQAPTGAADEYTNVAQVTAADQWDPTSTPGNDDGDQSEDDEDFADAVPQSSDLALVKTSSNDAPLVGETVTFTITVDNLGPDTATAVAVTDVLPAGLDYVAGTIAGGSSQDPSLDPTLSWTIDSIDVGVPVLLTYDAVVVAVPDGAGGLDAAAYLNAAEITASDQFDPNSDPASSFDVDDLGDGLADNDESQVQLAPTVADLSIAKASAATPQVGEIVTVTLTVTNDGPDDASSVEVVDVLPLSLTYQAGSAAGGTTQNDTDPKALVWTIDSIPAFTTVDLTYDVLVEPPTGSTDEYLNQAEITQADQWDPDSDPASSFDVDDLGDGVADDDEAEFTIDPQVADIEIDKVEPAAAPNVGDVVTYQIVVTNTGPDDASAVEVTDLLPDGLTYQAGSAIGGDAVTILLPELTWTIDALAVGVPVTLEYEVLVEAPTGAVGEYTNVAQVTASDQFDPDSAPANDDATEDDYESTTIAPQVADLSLTKAVDPVGANVGDTLEFTVTLTNLGPDPAGGVVVEDDLPIGYTYNGDIGFDAGTSAAVVTPDDAGDPTLSWTVDGLEPGESVELTYSVTIDEPVGAADEYTNVAEVTASDQFDPDSTPNNDDGDQSEDDEAAVAFVPFAADLELTKSLSDAMPNIGDVVTFTVEVFNAGPDPATNVGVADVVPAGYVVDELTISGGGALAVDTISWTIPTIASAATITLTYDAEVVAMPDGFGGLDAAAYENVAQVTAADTFDPDSTPDNDDGDQSEDDEAAAVAAPQVADLELTKTAPDGPVNVGDTVVYTLTLTNVGPSAATNVAVADVLPAGLAYVSGSIMGGSGQGVAGDTLSWTVDLLASGDSIDLTYQVTVEAVPDGAGGLDPAAYVNAAQVTASDQWDPDSAPDNDDGDQSEDDEATSALIPDVSDLSIAKASTAEPQVGDAITVTLTVTNDGPSVATGVAVTDAVPPGLVYQAGTMLGGTTQNDTDPSLLVWTIDSINAGDSVILEYVVEVQAPTGSTDEYLNQAEITAAAQWDPDSDPASSFDDDDLDDGVADDDEAEFLVDPQVADLSIDKIPPFDSPNAGDVISFSIVVTNVGPDDATNVDVTDTLPAGLTYEAGSAIGGDAVAIALPDITWSIDNLAAGTSVVLEYSVLVEAPTGAAGEFTNVAEVTAVDQFDPDSTPGNGDTAEDDYDTETIVPQQADLSLVKSTDDTTPEIGDVITFSIEVSNDGPDAATNVAVTDLLPAGLEYQPGSITGGDGQDDTGDPTLAWSIDTLDPGAPVVLTYDVEIVAVVLGDDVDPAAYVNQAQIVASDQFDPDSDPATGPDVDDDGDGNPVDDDESIVALDPNVADVSVVKTAPVTAPNIGDVVEMTIAVTNDGPDAAEDLEITDVLPAGMEYVPGSIAGGTSSDDGTAPTLTWVIDSLAPNTAATLRYEVVVVAVPDGLGGLDAAAYANAAEVTGATTFDPDSDPATSFDVDEDGDGDPVDDDESSFTVAPLIADLSMTKAVDDATPQIGDVVTFTLTVTNDGPDDATAVSVADALPAGLEYQDGTIAGGDDADGSGDPTLVWTIDALATGTSVDLTYEALVVAVPDGAGDVDPAAYANQAQVVASDQWDPDSDPATGPDVDEDGDGDPLDDDEFVVQVDPEVADISLDKSSDAAPNIGDVVTFTITVANDGPDDAIALEIVDVLPAGFVYQAASIAGGTTQDDAGDPTLAWTIDLLASGDSIDLSYSVEVVAVVDGAGGLDPAAYLNAAQVTGSGTWDPDSDPDAGFGVDDYSDGVDDDDESAFQVAPQIADLRVDKAPSEARPNIGDVVTFTVSVTNDGPDAATNVAVQDVLPPGLEYQAGSIAGGTTQDDAGAPTLAWTIASIASGAFVDLTYDVLVVAVTDATAALDPAAYRNEAQVTASDQWDPDSDPATGTAVDEDGDGNPVDDDEFIFEIEPQVSDLALAKSIEDTTPEVGEILTFTVTLTNDGPDDATNIGVEDVLPAGLVYQAGTIAGGTTQDDALDPILSWTVDALSAGDSVDLTYDVEIVAVPEADDVDLTAYLNAAQITASDQWDPDSDPATGFADDDLADGQADDDETQVQVNPNVADLSVTKTAPADRPDVGDVVTLTITLTNDGPDTATDVEITDVLPAGMAYQPGSIGGGDAPNDADAPTLVWTVASLASGTSVDLSYDVEVLAVPDGLGGLDPVAYVNAAEVTGSATWDPDSDAASGFDVDDLGDGIADDDETTFAFDPPVADVSLAKAVSDGTPEIGDVVTFTLTLTNEGPDTSSVLEVADVLPTGFAYQVGTMTGGSLQDDSAAPLLSWQVDEVAAGGVVELTYQVEIVAVPDGAGDVDAAAYVNAAEVVASGRWDPDSDPAESFDVDDLADGVADDDEAVVQVDPEVADLSVTTTASNTAPALGEVVTFTVVLTNDGPDAAGSIVVTDALPAGLIYVPGTINGGDTQDDLSAPTLTWTVATLAPGASVELTYDVVVTAVSDGAGGLDPAAFVNAAQVGGAATWDPDSDPAAGFGVDDYGDGVADDDEAAAAVLPAVLGVAKSLGAVINNGDGTYHVSYLLTVENMGLVDISDVVVTDDIVGQFAALSPTGFAAADGTLSANAGWDGSGASNILADGESLAVGAVGTVMIDFTVTPGADLGPHENVATATGVSPTGTTVADESTAGSDPDADGDDTDGTVDGDGVPDEGVPTVVLFSEAPSIGAAKALAGEPVSRGDGSFALTFDVVVENTGDVTLAGVEVEDDLATVFAEPAVFEVTALTSADLTVNAAYDGSADTGLLAGTDTLAVGASGVVTFEVVVAPMGVLGPLENQATASGISPTGIGVIDLSQDGSDVDPDGDGDPTNDNEPTPITLPALGGLTGIVWYDLQGDGVSVGELELSGIAVVLVMPGPDGVLGTGDDVERIDVTESPYFFDNVPAGEVEVFIDVATLPEFVTQTFDRDLFLDNRTTATIVAGEVTQGVDFGYIEEIELVVVKTGPPAATVGSTLSWLITVDNTGTVPARPGVTVTDVLPPGVALTAVDTDRASCTIGANEAVCTLDDVLEPGDSFALLVATVILEGAEVVNGVVIESGPQQIFADGVVETATAVTAIEPLEALPRTGQDLARFALWGAGMLLAGAVLVRFRRRRTGVHGRP